MVSNTIFILLSLWKLLKTNNRISKEYVNNWPVNSAFKFWLLDQTVNLKSETFSQTWQRTFYHEEEIISLASGAERLPQRNQSVFCLYEQEKGV